MQIHQARNSLAPSPPPSTPRLRPVIRRTQKGRSAVTGRNCILGNGGGGRAGGRVGRRVVRRLNVIAARGGRFICFGNISLKGQGLARRGAAPEFAGEDDPGFISRDCGVRNADPNLLDWAARSAQSLRFASRSLRPRLVSHGQCSRVIMS